MFDFAPAISIFGVPKAALTHRVEFDAIGPIYEGWAKSIQSPGIGLIVVAVTPGADTALNVVGHGLAVGSKIEFTNTVGEWSALKGIHTVKNVVGVDDFEIEFNSAAFVDPWSGDIHALSPRMQDPIWAILRRTFTINNPTLEEWADGDTLADNVWNDRATLAYQ